MIHDISQAWKLPAELLELATLRQKHLQPVRDLLQAIKDSNVGRYLSDQFKCP